MHQSATDRAHRLFLSALDHRARFDEDRMLHDLRATWRADPAYLPAIAEVLSLAELSYLPASFAAAADSLAGAQPDKSLGECIRGLLSDVAGYRSPLALPPHPSDDARACAADLRLRHFPRRGEEANRVVLARSLWRRFPDSPSFAAQLAADLGGAEAWEELVAVAAEMADRRRHPFVRLQGYFNQVLALGRLGRSEEAAQVERRGDADSRQAGGAVRLAYLQHLADYQRALLRDLGGDSLRAAQARRVIVAAEAEMPPLVAQAGPIAATGWRLAEARRLLDNGQLATSLQAWDRLARFADSLGQPALQACIRVSRGRTLVKLGRVAEAERDLRAGRAFARRAGHLQWEYEAEHNLLHLYEAAKKDPEARRAGEAFVALTQRGELRPVQLMAHHDMAWFYLRRGERERARRHFDAVVSYTDSMPGYDYWAGEYFELTGDLDRAEAYYLRSDVEVDTRAYAALARLAEARGDLRAAVRYAEASDVAGESARYPEVVPLLPGILARHGRAAEAAAGLAHARERTALQGQVAAWATLSLDLALLDLKSGDPRRAAALADSALEASGRVAATEVGYRAHAVAGLARVRLGGPEAGRGLTALRTTMLEVRRTHQAALEAELLTWYGEALGSVGRPHAALAALGRAADLTDSIAVSLSLDPARAGYRAAQLRISNAALEVILGERPDPGELQSYAAWSVRRKGRGVLERQEPRPAPSLERLRHSLGPDQAILDYTVLDSTIAALVITSRAVTVNRLTVTPDVLQDRIATLAAGLAPRIGSEVDTAHARFDEPVAEQLYADLLGSLESVLAGRNRLIIVADGPLHLVPFDALIASRAPVLTYALDRFTISQAPSLAVAGGREPRRPAGRVLLVAGPPGARGLEGWESELEAVRTALPGASIAELRDSAATESAFRRAAPGASLLHLAAHAWPNDAQPLYAYLSLVPGAGDDGRLNAYEIGHLRLASSLVVLSGCETAAGRLLGGEGVLSLSRAFLRAGASGTVATLWPVGRPTADLMRAFYEDLGRGVPPSVALRSAKLALRHGRWPSPLHWAGFVLVTRGIR